MLISLNWLKKFVSLDEVKTDELITLIGARLVEVEGTIDQREKYNNIYVVKVVSVEKIPDTHLTLCKIDDDGKTKIARDEDGLIQVMCGAPNVRAGMLAAWIAPGAIVPSSVNEDAPFVIGTRKMLGKYESHGMLAGADELDFGDEHKTIAEMDPKIAKAGQPFGELFGLNDIILEIENKSLTHRPDTFGMIGFAREVAGILGQKFETPEWLMDFGEKDFVMKGADLKITLADSKICPRYTALIMEKHGDDKPKYLGEMETLLARSGMRPISPLVDVTNYLMLLTGQPLHAFDYDKLVKVGGKPTPEIIVRQAKKGEKLELLDGKKVELVESDIVITSSDKPVALAGAMGGKNTEIDENTRKIIVESATFSLYNLRKTQMAHGIFSEAITRFTKGQPAGQTLPVVKEFANMVAGGMKPLALIDEWPNGGKKNVVKITTQQINELLGTEYTYATIEETLRNVGFEIDCDCGKKDKCDCEEINVMAPYWRTDIHITEDVIEEVGRLLGYDNITPRVPRHGTATPNELFELKTQIRQTLSAAGANELLTYSFVHGDLLTKVGQDVENSYKIVNSISPDLQYVRQQIAPSLLVKVAENLKNGIPEFGLFEMNQLFCKESGMDEENVPVLYNNLAFVYASKDEKSCFYQIKNYLMYLAERLNMEMKLVQVSDKEAAYIPAFIEPKRSAKVMLGDEWLGVVGEVKKSVAHELKVPEGTAIFELNLDTMLGKVGSLKKDFRTSQYPSVGRDITIVVKNDVPYEKVAGQIEKLLSDQKLVYKIMPTAIYQAEAEADLKISFHLEFASLEKTLENKEILSIMTKLEKLSKN
ncbi:MAG: phenylalanine--tRNA ligase subunit beta [Candidatus Saccharimonadales bacterium]